MNQILIIIAIVGIGYLLYRSLVIKRQPNEENEQGNSSPASHSEPSAGQSASAQAKSSAAHNLASEDPATEDAAHDQQNPSAPSSSPAADSTISMQSDSIRQPDNSAPAEVGQEAVEEAHQAEVKAAEKAHMQVAEDATKSDLERLAGSGTASNNAPKAPGEAETQAAALRETEDPLARHRLYQQIVEQCYRARDEESGRLALLHYAKAHIGEFDEINEPLKKQNGGKLPQVATFKHYAAVLTESGQYDEAIKVCQQALSYDLKDGTKTGYQGRLQRIEKLKAKHQD